MDENVQEIKPKPKASDTFGNSERTILGLTEEEDRKAFIFVMGLLIIVVIGFIFWMSQPHPANPCRNPQSFACLDQRVQECAASEKYTKEQCVILVGGNK